MDKKTIEPELTIKRAYFSDCTLGRVVSLSGKSVFTLELPWLGNEPEKSCIPEGIYPYRKAMSPSRGEVVIWIDKVPDRTNIQIHPANETEDLLGCIAPGMSIQDYWADNIPDVLNSGGAMDRIMKEVPDTGYIKITDSQKPGRGVYA